MTRTPRRHWSFTGQIIVLQLVMMLGVALVLSGAFSWITWQQRLDQAQAESTAIARSVASDPQVQRAVELSRDDIRHSDAEAAEAVSARTDVARTAEAVRERTGALFVVVAGRDGIRLSHPNPDEIGRPVSTDMGPVLQGEEVQIEERGTLGQSARAKVPLRSPSDGSVIGEVSVGLSRDLIWSGLPAALWPVALAALGTVLLGVVASILVWRRLRRLTLGVRPEDFVSFAQNQEATLESVDEGVIGVGDDGAVTTANDVAIRLIGDGTLVGRRWDDLSLPEDLHRAVRRTLADRRGCALETVVASRVVLADVRPVGRGGHDVGCVVILRDKTDVLQMTERLQAVDAMSQALRVQRHEFANRLHAVHGLLEVGQTDEARRYLGRLLEHGPLRYPVRHLDRVSDPYLQAFLGAKGTQAAEHGVLLTVGSETAVNGRVHDAETIATVLGNLVDNALRAAINAERNDDVAAQPWVEVEIMSDGDECVLVVADSGDGLPAGTDPFVTTTEQLYTLDAVQSVETRAGEFSEAAGGLSDGIRTQHGGLLAGAHGRGIGLPLSREIARRMGGDVWVASARTENGGAVFCARLPDTVEVEVQPCATVNDAENEE